MVEEKSLIWLSILTRLDRINRRIKEPGWYDEDKRNVYFLKDEIIRIILHKNPICLFVELEYVPYYIYCRETKDRAGVIMREDREDLPFEYYLSIVEPTQYDIEVPEKAMVEMNVTCMNQTSLLRCEYGEIVPTPA